MKKTNKVFKILLVAILIIATNMITYFFITKKEQIINTEKVSLETMQTSASNSYITTEQHLSEIANISGVMKKEISSSNISVTASGPFLRYKSNSTGKDYNDAVTERRVARFNPNLDSNAKIITVILNYQVDSTDLYSNYRQTIATLSTIPSVGEANVSHPYTVVVGTAPFGYLESDGTQALTVQGYTYDDPNAYLVQSNEVRALITNESVVLPIANKYNLNKSWLFDAEIYYTY